LKTIACIPAFNAEKIINSVIADVANYVDRVIVCDDGSSDNTSKIAKDSGATVITHKKNLGKGGALKSLFGYVKGQEFDVLVTIDGDGQNYPEEIPKLIAPIQDGQADIVIGYRFESAEEMPKYRRFGNKLFDKLTNAATDLPFKDTQSGFRAYSKRAIDQISFIATGYAADSEILVSASRQAMRILEVKVKVKYNTGGTTSVRNPVRHGTDVITLLLEVIAIKHPLAYLGLPGLISTIIGIIFTFIMITHFNASGFFSVPTTLVAIGFLSLGILLTLTSVLLFTLARQLQR